MRLRNEQLIAVGKIGHVQGHVTVAHLLCYKLYTRFILNHRI